MGKKQKPEPSVGSFLNDERVQRVINVWIEEHPADPATQALAAALLAVAEKAFGVARDLPPPDPALRTTTDLAA